MDKEKLTELMDETRRRQRLKTDLAEFDGQMKEMMNLNISLPVILGWLEKEGKTTTLPALRRYVKRVFGDAYYDDFVRRNGWLKTKAGDLKKSEKPSTTLTRAAGAPDVDVVPANRPAPTPSPLPAHPPETKDGISKVQEVLMQPPTKFPKRQK